MAERAVELKYYAPVFKIKVNGKNLEEDISNVILSVSIEQELNATNKFNFVVQDEFRGGNFLWLGSDLFKLGNNVSIELGYTGKYNKMIEGKILSISANFFEGSAPTITVEGSDKGFEFLSAKSVSHVFKDKKDSDIVREIAGLANMASEIDDTSEVFTTKTKKGGKSYFEFIKDRAKANGYEYNLSGGKLYFVKPGKNDKVITNLKWGLDLISFKPDVNTAKAVSEVIVRSWDKESKKPIVGRAKAGDEQNIESGKKSASQVVKELYGEVVKEITDQVVKSVAEANKLAKSELDKASEGFLTGSGSTIGNPDLKPGFYLNIEGLSKLFSGKYYMKKVTHSYDSSGFTTNFEAERNFI